MDATDTRPATTSAADEASPLLRHFPEEVRTAYARLRRTGDPAAADVVVLAIVRDHQPVKAAAPAPLQDQQTLIGDLGFDSVAITEMVFFIEDLFRVSVSNDEILSIRTVGELRAFVRRKLSAVRPSANPPAA